MDTEILWKIPKEDECAPFQNTVKTFKVQFWEKQDVLVEKVKRLDFLRALQTLVWSYGSFEGRHDEYSTRKIGTYENE